jgi:hypothetical protein
MNRLAAAALALLAAPLAALQAPAPSRPAGYDRLQGLVGSWTLEGREKTFSETCDWHEGRFLVRCTSEIKRKDGSLVRGVSLLGYLPEEDTYTYFGFDSSGRNETLRGKWVDGVLTYEGEARVEGRVVKSRVKVGPFGGPTVDFVAESSTDGGPWAVDARMKYVKRP